MTNGGSIINKYICSESCFIVVCSHHIAKHHVTAVNNPSRTFRASGVELLHRVVQADADRGKAHLPVQPGHQAAVEAAGALGLHHGEDGAEHASVSHRLAVERGFGFALNLEERGRKADATTKKKDERVISFSRTVLAWNSWYPAEGDLTRKAVHATSTATTWLYPEEVCMWHKT